MTSTDTTFTILRAADVTDYTGDAPGAYLAYARPMGSAQLGLNVRVLEPGQISVPPGVPHSWGHSHTQIEELYLVIDGTLTLKLADEVLQLDAGDAALVPPGVMRQMRNTSDAPVRVVMASQKVADPHGEVETDDEFWA